MQALAQELGFGPDLLRGVAEAQKQTLIDDRRAEEGEREGRFRARRRGRHEGADFLDPLFGL